MCFWHACASSDITGRTESGSKLPEVDETVSITVEEPEEANSQGIRVDTASPGEEYIEEACELLQINAVLVQVGQAGVMPVCWAARPTPVAGGQILCLQDSGSSIPYKSSHQDQLWL